MTKAAISVSVELERLAALGLWTVPGLGPESLKALRACGGGALAPFLTAPGLSNTHNEQLGDRLAEVVRRQGNACEKIGVHFGTDAAAYGPLHVPAVVFGPGDIAQAHTDDEWIELDQLRRAADILFEFARAF